MLVYHFTDLVKCFLVYMSVVSQYCTVLIIIIALSYNLKSESMMPPVLIFLKITLSPWGLLWVHVNFGDCFSISVKNRNFNRDCTDTENHFGQYGHFEDIGSSDAGTWYFSTYWCLLQLPLSMFHHYQWTEFSPLCLKLFLSILFFLMVL